MKLKLYTQEGKEKGTIELISDIFEFEWKPALLRQVVLAFLANARTPVAHTKGRGDVRGGGRKPWKQKGTGRARHGSRRSPIWVGGGVTHGPTKEKDYSQKVNKKMRKGALKVALSRKVKDGELLPLESLIFDNPKTKDAKSVIDNLSKIEGFEKLGYKKRNTALVVIPQRDANVEKSFSNFGNITVKDAVNINAYDVVRFKYLILADATKAQEVLQERLINNK